MSTPPKVSHPSRPTYTQIPATLVTCMVPVIAEAGDQLLIFNNLCIGVSTATAPSPSTTSSPTPKPIRKPKRKPKPKPKQHRASASKMKERVAKVKELLANSPSTGLDLKRKLKLSKGELNSVLSRLNKENALKPAKIPGKRRIYQLTSSPSAAS